MNGQKSLFPTEQPYRSPWAGRARRGDPETSKLAAAEIAPVLGEVQKRALDAVRRNPGKTAQELADLEEVRDPRTINRRLGELASEEIGLLIRGPARRCTITGRSAATWTIPATEDPKENR